MTTKDIIGRIQEGIDDYRKTSLTCNPEFAPTHPQILELIDLYRMDKFRDESYDELGFLKPFYNIVNTPVDVSANWLDIDVKDIRFFAQEGQSYYPVLFFEREAKRWMQDNRNCYALGREMGFGLFLNAIIPEWARYGHLVLKKANKKIYLMPIVNLIVEPGAESLTNAHYIIEKHDFSPFELRKKPWDNIEKAIKKCEVDGHIFVYELIAEMEGTNQNYFIVAVKPHQSTSNIGEGVLLFSDTLDELPYKELPFDKIPGRWLGRGQVEKLFHTQIYQNKIAEYKAKGAHWTSKHIYQSRDENINKNLMTEVKDGTILTIMSEVNPIAVEERNLAFYREEELRYDFLADKLTFSWDLTRGERPPAGLTLGQSILQSRTAGGFYERKKEDLGLFLKDVLYDWILPEFQKQNKKAHKLLVGEFIGDDLDIVRNLILNHRTNQEIIKSIARTGRFPSSREYEMLKSLAKEVMKKDKDITIPADFYRNLRYKIQIDITGEQIDLASRISTLQTVLVMISQNPTILQDKNVKKVFFQLLDYLGISPTMFEGEPPELTEAVGETVPTKAERGGSVARLPSITMPTQTTVPTTI